MSFTRNKMASPKTLSFLFIVLVSLTTFTRGQNIVMGPVDVETVVGSEAIFYCKVRPGSLNLVYWVVNRTIGLGPFVNQNEAYPRYEIFGDDSLGYYNLRIRDVTASDAVRYDCIVDTGNNTPNEEVGASLIILSNSVIPAAPICEIVTPADITLNEGDSLENFRCISSGGVPLGELRWSSLNADQRTIDELDSDFQASPDSITAISRRRVVTADDHNTQMACFLRHPRLNNDEVCYLPLNGRILVRHRPQIELPPNPEVRYLQTRTVTIRCQATAYPDITDGPVLGFASGLVYNLTSSGPSFVEATVTISRGDAGREINCTATNAQGAATSSIQVVFIPFLPSWLVVVIMIAGTFILFILALLCCCCCCNCCKREKSADIEHKDVEDNTYAGYDVNDSRPSSMHKANGVGGDDQPDADGFTNIPLDDMNTEPSEPFASDGFTETPMDDLYPPPPPDMTDTTPLAAGDGNAANDLETGEVNDGYLQPMPPPAEQFPPMIEDDHLMGEKKLSTFKPDSIESPPAPIPKVEDE